MADLDAPALSFVPEQTQIVLIGTSETNDDSGLEPLPGVANNVRDLAVIFRDSSIIGLPSVTSILNPPNQDELATNLATIASKATDTLVVYYAGHGMKASFERGLYLAIKATTKQLCHLNGFSFDKLRTAMANSPALKKVLILDCCFSGEAVGDEMGDDVALLASNIDNIKGTYTIASSPANKLSIAPIGATYTAFTGELITLLKEGTGGTNAVLTLEEIYEHLRDRIKLNENLPEPQRKSLLDGSKIIFVRNHVGVGALELRVTSLQRAVNARLRHIEMNIEELAKTGVRPHNAPAPEQVGRRNPLAPVIFLLQALAAPVIATFVIMEMAHRGPAQDRQLEAVAVCMLGLSVVSAVVSFLSMRPSRVGLPDFFSLWYPARASFMASVISVMLMVPIAIVAPEPIFAFERTATGN